MECINPAGSINRLPCSVFEEIITILRNESQFDGWLADLRLVNSIFNEAILHVLIYQRPQHTRYFCRPHMMACHDVQRCYNPVCRTLRQPNWYFGRYLLQAKLFASADLSLSAGASSSIQEIREVLRLTRRILSRWWIASNPMLQSFKKWAHTDARIRTATDHPILSDKIYTMFTECILITKAAEHGDHTERYLTTLSSFKEWFWLKAVSCLSGNVELFQHFCSQEASSTDSTMSLQTSHKAQTQYLLQIACTGGHGSLVDRLLRSQSSGTFSEDVVWRLLVSACIGGDIHITQSLLSLCPPEARSVVCMHALTCVARVNMPSTSYQQCAQVLVSELGSGYSFNSFKLTQLLHAQVRRNKPEILRSILTGFDNQLQYEEDVMAWYMSPLWMASLNGSIECLMVLQACGYFDKIPRSRLRDLASSCIKNAMRANNWQMCEIFSNLADKQSRDHWRLFILSCVEAEEAWSGLKKALETGEHGADEEQKIRKVTQNAIGLLRVENARILLGHIAKRFPGLVIPPLTIDYGRKKIYPRQFEQIQNLLAEYALPPLKLLDVAKFKRTFVR